LKVKNNQLDEVHSDVHAGKSSAVSDSMETTSNLDRTSKVTENEYDDLENQFGSTDSNEEQRLFYSKCLSMKMKLKSREIS